MKNTTIKTLVATSAGSLYFLGLACIVFAGQGLQVPGDIFLLTYAGLGVFAGMYVRRDRIDR